MKIAYLLNHQIWRNDGVTKKIAVQVDAWQAAGHEVEAFCITRRTGASILQSRQYRLRNPVLGRLTANKELIRDLSTFHPDVVYLRYDIWSATIAWVIARYKTVAELNTIDLEEYKLLVLKERSIKALLRYIAYVVMRGRLFCHLDGIVGVTHEIVADASVTRYKLPSAVVPNGIDLGRYGTLSRDLPESDSVRLFFIATPGQPWHGVDFVIDLARKLPEFEFHIVGIAEGAVNSNIFWHGYLSQDKYIQILRRCHVCIGSLALFRNNMREACPLKVREYLAYGFPIILGYRDTGFNADLPDYVLLLDLAKSGVTDEIIRATRAFCLRMKGRLVPSSDLSFIDANRLERERLGFLKTIADMPRR